MAPAHPDRGDSWRPAVATFAFGATLLVVAATLDAEPLYVPGVAFTLLSLIACVWVLLSVRGIVIDRTVAQTRVIEDDALNIVIDVRAGRLPLPTGSVDDAILPHPAPLAVGRRHTRVRIAARFTRRGRRVLSPPRVLARDPFGLIARSVVSEATHEVLVLPRVEPVDVTGGGGGGIGLGLSRRRQVALAEVELDGLGPLQLGTPASRIHWPSIARLAEPQERRLNADGDRLPLVILDPRVESTPEGNSTSTRRSGRRRRSRCTWRTAVGAISCCPAIDGPRWSGRP